MSEFSEKMGMAAGNNFKSGFNCCEAIVETFRKEVELIKQLGFDGKSIINPRQIPVVNEVFIPKQKDIEKAMRVVAAIKDAEKKGSGVIAVNGKMVDRPVVLRAQRVIDLALASHVIKKEDLA